MNRSTGTAYWVFVTIVLVVGTQAIVAPMQDWYSSGNHLGVGGTGSLQGGRPPTPVDPSEVTVCTEYENGALGSWARDFQNWLDSIFGSSTDECDPTTGTDGQFAHETTNFLGGASAVILIGAVLGLIGLALIAGGFATSGAVRGSAPGISYGLVVVGAIVIAAGTLEDLFALLPPELGILLTLWFAVGAYLLYTEGMDYFAGRSG